jgi:hypothetical protein
MPEQLSRQMLFKRTVLRVYSPRGGREMAPIIWHRAMKP